MIPVQQTRFGKGQGNCLLACVASILHRPIETIPNFMLHGKDWFGALYEWCRQEDVGLLYVNPEDLSSSVFLNCYCIILATVDALYGHPDENHAVVGKCERLEDAADQWKWRVKMVFDPNPQGIKLDTLEHIMFLLPNQKEKT